MQINDVIGIFAQLHIFDLWKLSSRPAILIGVEVLRHFQDVTLDFGRKVVVVLHLAAGRPAASGVLGPAPPPGWPRGSSGHRV